MNELAVFGNKLVISNPGGLVKSIKPEEFGRLSRTRNPLIANLLYRIRYIEKLGTGIGRIRKALAAAKLPAPIFEFDGYSFLVNIYDKNYDSITNDLEKDLEGDLEKDLEKDLSDHEKQILSEIRKDSKVTQSQLSRGIGISERNVRNNIRKLKKKGFLTRVGPDKGGHWKSNAKQ